MALSADQLSEAVAVATKHIRKEIPSILTTANYLYKLMMDNKEYVSGGTKIQMPVGYDELDSQGFIDGEFDTISTNKNQMITFAELDWKYFYHNLSITLKEMTQTQDTPHAIKSLLKAKTELAKGSIARELSAAMHASAATSTKKFNGFDDIFAASGTAYAGLNNTDVANWLTEIDSSTQIVNFANLSKLTSKLKGRIQQFGDQAMDMKLDVMISNSAVLQAFKDTEQIKQRFINNGMLKAGFEGVDFNGLFWYVDEYADGTADGSTADNHCYLITSKTMKMFHKYGLDGKASPMDQTTTLVNQPVQAKIGYLVGNMGCTNRRLNGVYKTLIA